MSDLRPETGVRYVGPEEVYKNHLLSAVWRYVEDPTAKNLAVMLQSLATFVTEVELSSK